MNDKIIIIVGKAGSGKDSLARLLSERLDYKLIVMNTSRPKRPHEIEGKDYYFKTKEDFVLDIEKNNIVHYKTYDTLLDGNKDIWFYGLNKTEIEENKSAVVVLTLDYLDKMKEIYGDRVLSFYISTNDNIREIRAKERSGFEKTEWDRRLLDDTKVFKSASDKVNYTIYNNSNSIEKSYAKLVLKIDFELSK